MEDVNTSSNSHAWENLFQHHESNGGLSLIERFNANPERGSQLSFSCGDLWVDVSKQSLNAETVELLFQLAREKGVNDFFHSMSKGAVVNLSEEAPALHTSLRNPLPSGMVEENLGRMKELHQKLKTGHLVGYSGKQICSVVNLGIGGSHLGSFMAFEALKDYGNPELEVRWSSGLDIADLEDALLGLDPEQTIVIVCSKTFSTFETLSAARRTQTWFLEGGVNNFSSQMFAATSEPENALAFGIEAENIFSFSSSIGGRFSLASPVSLGLMLSIGYENFDDMLQGMHLIDTDVLANDKNIPLLLGLIDVWNRSVLGANSLAVVPYSYRLREFSSYLQQLMMESLGKSISSTGESIEIETGMAVWGASGTDAQHSFFQALHQGTEIMPIDLIGFAQLSDKTNDELFANLIAQAQALAFGQDLAEDADSVTEYELLPGNRPSTVILAPELSPNILGQLIALYEHRTVATGVVWGINPFDQWGVEHGKKAALKIVDELKNSEVSSNHDSSTTSLIARYKHWRND